MRGVVSDDEARQAVDAALYHLSSRLDGLIQAKLAPSLGNIEWPIVLTELDRLRGKPARIYERYDLQAQLRMLTERLGDLGYPLDDHTRIVSALGSELRVVRNRWAHHDAMSLLDAWRANDFAVRLLERLDDTGGLDKARELCDAAFQMLVAAQGAATPLLSAKDEVSLGLEHSAPQQTAGESVEPDDAVFVRDETVTTPTVGSRRHEYEPWVVVPVGDIAVLDDLPKKAAKEQLRAVAVEIAEFEGPIHLGRLAQLCVASFGLKRLWPEREKRVTYQIKQADLFVDSDKFVWPSDINRREWYEFRPNASWVDRPFTAISPVEIANAMRFLIQKNPGMSPTELDAATLQTFGRKRRTKALVAHLAKARSRL